MAVAKRQECNTVPWAQIFFKATAIIENISDVFVPIAKEKSWIIIIFLCTLFLLMKAGLNCDIALTKLKESYLAKPQNHIPKCIYLKRDRDCYEQRECVIAKIKETHT